MTTPTRLDINAIPDQPGHIRLGLLQGPCRLWIDLPASTVRQLLNDEAPAADGGNVRVERGAREAAPSIVGMVDDLGRPATIYTPPEVMRRDPARWPTPEEFVREWEQRTAAQRVDLAGRILEDAQAVERLQRDREALQARADAAEAEAARLHSWDGLMELLDEHWPADIFPTLPDDEQRDPGPRIVSLLRWVADLTATVARVKAAAQHPHKGPDDTDASMLRAAAKRLRDGYEPGGSWTKQTVAKVCEVVAAALEGSPTSHTHDTTEETR